MIDYLVNIKFENVDCIYYHLTYNKNERITVFNSQEKNLGSTLKLV